MQMLAVLLCLGNKDEGKKSIQPVWKQFIFPKCSIVNLQLLQLANEDSKDTEGCCGGPCPGNWELRDAMNFSSSRA